MTTNNHGYTVSPSPLTEPMELLMLTAYLDNLQHASATVVVAHCLLGSLTLGLAPFVPAFIAQHVAAVRGAR
ncbi:hypothetical protein [Methylobacterium sp. OT2]|uniref:hypothetical protein n=1 Tax=Methylobacterium sp. OT2 TaxID=2813779 RepID=UPI00197BCA9A|nr:hypothetical protein [Methylobacterium sp. OT2]MBN4095609.1 hypothetical protein [Methylobacterium sp. OT2]